MEQEWSRRERVAWMGQERDIYASKNWAGGSAAHPSTDSSMDPSPSIARQPTMADKEVKKLQHRAAPGVKPAEVGSAWGSDQGWGWDLV